MASAKNLKIKKFWLVFSVVVSLGFLGIFKYFNFFAETFAELLAQVGLHPNSLTLHLILPVGISFYTFHGLSYIIDLYKGRIEKEKDFVNYAVFVSFFPLLIAGPIERATHLLPQIKAPRTFNYHQAVDGLKQIVWGLFKKVVIADNCAEFANTIFNHSPDYSGSTLVVGALCFTVQIYCDFSGYSDIALGVSRLFGIELLRNFAFPYFSRDIAEFWRRWHISLTTWFRDYLYIPLGGSRGGLWMKIRNTFIIFLVSGFWHGANWTFIAWGALNAVYFLPLLLTNKNRAYLEIVALGKVLPTWKDGFSILTTFLLTTLAWVFFRAESIQHALSYLGGMFNGSLFSLPQFPGSTRLGTVALLTGVFFLLEWMGREQLYALAKVGSNWPKIGRWLLYYALIFAVFYFSGNEQQFIYFQF